MNKDLEVKSHVVWGALGRILHYHIWGWVVLGHNCRVPKGLLQGARYVKKRNLDFHPKSNEKLWRR